MTRIGYFNLYECPKCGQIHTKPEYASISFYGSSLPRKAPPDAYYAPTDLKTCQQCGKEISFAEFQVIGQMDPLGINEIGADPTKLYPRFSN